MEEALRSLRPRHHCVGPAVYFPLALLLSAHPFLPTTLSAPSSKRSVSSSSPAMATAKAQPPPPPPVANKVKHEMEMFGDVRIDNYYWLRDDSRSDPQVLSYLRDENAYTDLLMSGTKHLENQIYAEIRGRIKEDDISVPLRKGPYYYYERNLEGKEYVQYCRRLVPNVEVPPSVYETMPTGPSAPPEHVILDVNIKAQEHAYYSIGAFKISPNSKLVAYAEDTKGDEIYTVYVIDAETRAPVGKPIVGVTPYLEWVGDEALLYITMDETLRPDKVWLHKLETDQSSDSCLYHEKDNMFSVDLEASESKKFVFVGSESKTTRFIFYLDVSKPEEGLMVLTPRLDGIDTSASHRGNHFFIKRRSDEFFNSEVLACPLNNISETTVLLPHRESVKIQDIQLFSDHLVVYERENGLPKVTFYRLPAVGEPLGSLQGGQTVDFLDPIYSVDPSESQFYSSILRFSYSSLRTPYSVYDYDMNTSVSVLKKIQTVLGNFDASKYITERKWANAQDGTQIPISIVYRKDLVKLDGSDPLLLYGYGSYEICVDAHFQESRLSLLDRGFIFAIAHIRGGGEMGRQWYENGKLLKKKNTFTDFIACAEYLIEMKYCSKEKLCIEGRSAGGLLIGAVLNMRPDLFRAAIAGVPFVDVLTTMLDPTIPLTTSEWEEWGDPRKEEFYFYMKSYSPVDNIKAQNYPNILVTAGLNDPRVLYSEPAKLVAKLRDTKTDDNILLFKCEMAAGHSSKSGRFEKLQEYAFTYTFIIKSLDMVPSRGYQALKATLYGHAKPVKLMTVAGHKTSLRVIISKDSKVRVWNTTTSSTVHSSCCVGMTSVLDAPVDMKCYESLLFVAAGSSVSTIDLRTMQRIITTSCGTEYGLVWFRDFTDATCPVSSSHEDKSSSKFWDPVSERGIGTSGLSGLRDSSEQQLNQAVTINQSDSLNGASLLPNDVTLEQLQPPMIPDSLKALS